jgi:hypothetical protein
MECSRGLLSRYDWHLALGSLVQRFGLGVRRPP